MKVQIKNPKIPDGYTFRRCDNSYTADEFITRCSFDYDDGSTCNLAGDAPKNQYAVKYVQDHPKSEYTADDVKAVMRMECRTTLERSILKPKK